MLSAPFPLPEAHSDFSLLSQHATFFPNGLTQLRVRDFVA